MSRLKNFQKGFTLIELLASMAIGAIVLLAITTTFISQSRSYHSQDAINAMQQSARAAMDMITREVRMAGYNTNDTLTFTGIEYDASQIRIQANLDGNTDTNGANEDIIYAYDAGNDRINRTAGGVTEALVDYIYNFTFEYLDESGIPTTTSANIRQIQITITARTSKPDPNYASNGGFRTYSLTSLVTPRNLAY